ncbi:MAG: sigma-70 family RNA polymerase sigma factor [Blastocatellia bacterium]
MTSLESLIGRVRNGDDDAYEVVVRRFQDMAVGYGYSILRDFHLAEDAAQEAFLEAYRNLDKLREPAAFPGWFRKIVFKQCDRITRNKSFAVTTLDAVGDRASESATQADAVEQSEMKDRILTAVDSLPEHERSATTLYYISGYSQEEVAQFLDVPVTTIKKRLYSARNRLREMLIDLVEDSLRERRPSRDEMFATRLIEILKAARSGDAGAIKELLEQDPRLAAGRDPLGNTALILAVNSGHNEIAELLLSAGVRPDIYEAASIGRTELVAQYLNDDRSMLDSYSPEGFTALALAAHFGHLETLEFLISRGGNVNAISKHEMRVTPLHASLFGRRIEAARMLIAAGADVTATRGSGGPRGRWTPLHYSASLGFREIAEMILERGADLNALDHEGRTPLKIARESGQDDTAKLLLLNGATE